MARTKKRIAYGKVGCVALDSPHSFTWRPQRREFLLGAAAGASLVGGSPLCADESGSGLQLSCCTGDDPVGCIREKKFDILTAFVEAQLYALWCGPPGDDPQAIANDFLHFVAHLELELQRGVCGALTFINAQSFRRARKAFVRLSPWERTALFNQGEYPFATQWKRISWDEEYVLHTAVSSLAMIGRLVIGDRHPTRVLVGFSWSPQCRAPRNLVHIPPPPYPDLREVYDVCIVGSGAGGSVVAARAAEAGYRVLLVESGKWVSPDAIVERQVNAYGQEKILPPRGDRVLTELYRGAGVNVAGGLRAVLESRWDIILPWRRDDIQPQQTINVVQANVVGGGPYVNNAIHMEMRADAWNTWGPRQPYGVTYEDLWRRMQQIKCDEGVNNVATRKYAGPRSWKFVDGCIRAGEAAEPMPVSMMGECAACGADNSMDPFGSHIGGLHPWRPTGPNSYLMQALHAPVPAKVAHQLSAVAFQLSVNDAGVRATQLIVEDRRGLPPNCRGRKLTINARQYVLAAGTGASTHILHRSLSCAGLCAAELGARLTANVGCAVYAVFDQPIVKCNDPHSVEPGVAQCFLVERRIEIVNGTPVVVEPDLENWFHFPGTVAVALTGWFQEYAQIMRKYNHISIAGLFVPTAVRPENRILPDGSVRLELDRAEFELMLRGIERIGRIYLAAATPENGVSLYLPTKAVLLDRCGRPATIRTYGQLRWALAEVRKRGPEFLNLLTAHPQGGNALGGVVHQETFCVQLCDGRQIDNLCVADASIFPFGCGINPQLTIKALAHFAADRLLARAA